MKYDIWNDSQSSIKGYIGKPVTEEDIIRAEEQLGYKFPESYKELIREHNGGLLQKFVITTNEADGIYEEENVYVEAILGIDPDKDHSLLSKRFGNRFYSEAGFPDIGIVIAEEESGHEAYFLDYRECGKDGEPTVVVINNELDNIIVKIADSFTEFLNMLHD